MSFNQIYTLLMLGAALAVLFMPMGAGDRARSVLQGVYTPVARPVNAVADMVSRRIWGGGAVDEASPNQTRDPQTVYAENAELRQMVASLQGQLDALNALNAERERVGPVRQFCIPVRVAGGDAGLRPTLNLSSGTFSGIQIGQPVIYAGGVVGRISRAGESGSNVQLITDPQMRITGTFVRFGTDPAGRATFQHLAIEPAVAAGNGRGEMIIASIPLDSVQTAQLTPERDWFVIADPAWPTALQGYRVAVVKSVTLKRDAPLFAEVRLAPVGDLMRLREVQVMTKGSD